MRRGRGAHGALVAAAFGGFLALKMVLLEPLAVDLLGVEIVVVALLLPLALLLRGPGVALIAASCALAHWVHDGGVTIPLVTGASVGVAAAGALLLLRRRPDPLGWVAAGWVLTLLFAGAMAVAHSAGSGDLTAPFLQVVQATWLPINVLGVPLALLLHRRVPRGTFSGSRRLGKEGA